jgi:hypothetical protein
MKGLRAEKSIVSENSTSKNESKLINLMTQTVLNSTQELNADLIIAERKLHDEFFFRIINQKVCKGRIYESKHASS